MAAYEYDEAGVMATYFLVTFLGLILIPVTLSSLPKRSGSAKQGCNCNACMEQREKIRKRERGSLLSPTFSTKTYVLAGGWLLLAFLSWRASNLKVTNKVYDPFEILGISSSATEKEIKSHYKKLSKEFHPDKVKATAELTIEAIQDRFVQLTKAYKSLTDEKIRKNWLEWNNPDGPQSTSMGIALPKWIVESQNNIWVLGFYGLLFGVALPAVVGRWWFGNRQRTKDGIHAQSAAAFFKSINEFSKVDEVVSTLGKAYQWEIPGPKNTYGAEMDEIEKAIIQKAGPKYAEVKKLARGQDAELHPLRLRALILIFAHLTRVKIDNPALQEEQRRILLQTPLLLSALLNVLIARTWLTPTLHAMRLHSYLAQALPLDPPPRVRLTQLPGFAKSDVDSMVPRPKDISEVLAVLEDKDDERSVEAKKAISKWGRVEIVDASFKVIGERTVTPSAIVYLLVKLRITPPGFHVEPKDLSVDETKKAVKLSEEKDEAFLLSKQDSEEISEDRLPGPAHAPYWPAGRKPTWWLVLADEKQNRIVVPPVRISDVPYADGESERDYRSYKIQFQGPPQTGVYTWRLYVVSDTFAGEDAVKDFQLKVEDPAVDEEVSEDEISEPDEDTLAGQMAAMRGGAVKRRDDSDEESGTDDDEEEDSDSDSSDSDSD